MSNLPRSFYVVTLCFLTVVGSILYYYRNDIYQSYQDPGVPFQTYEKPPPLNYSQSDAWFFRPDTDIDPYTHPALADLFVIIPNIYNGGENWNVPVQKPQQIERLNRVVVPNYVNPYLSLGRTFAPIYRQASTYTFLTLREDARMAQNFAYQDVKQAFEEFLKNSPPERPIVIIGHRQGGTHAIRIIQDFFKEELRDRLAVAYVIDHPVPISMFEGSLSHITPCTSENDTQCIVSFNTVYPGEDTLAKHIKSQLSVFLNSDYVSVAGEALLCTNPLLWDVSTDYAPRRHHKGGIAAEGMESEVTPAPLTKQLGAECVDGLLYVDKPRSGVLRRPWRIGQQYKTPAFNLFSEDIRVNAQERIQALYEAGNLPRRVQAIDDLEILEITDSPITPVDE